MDRRFEIEMVENGRLLRSSMVNSSFTIKDVIEFYGLNEDDISSYSIKQIENGKVVRTINVNK